MRHFSTTIGIDAPPHRVRAVMVEVERWHEWTASIRRVERLEAGPLAVGSRARVHQPGLPPALWGVTALDDAGFTWVSRAPGVRVTVDHRVAVVGGLSQATLSIRYEGPLGGVLAWLTRGVNDRYLGMEAAGLKQRCEAG